LTPRVQWLEKKYTSYIYLSWLPIKLDQFCLMLP
jgi:hypothetical protein